MIHRHLTYPSDTAAADLSSAAIDDLLDRGTLTDWAPLRAAIRADPWGVAASRVLSACAAHPMYGTSRLWRDAVLRYRRTTPLPPELADLRRAAGMSQVEVAEAMGVGQPAVSKLERSPNPSVDALTAYVAAVGARLRLTVSR